MNSWVFGVVLAAVVFVTNAGDVKDCYEWPTETANYKSACAKCKEAGTGKEDLEKCIYKGWNMTDKDGNVFAKTITDIYVLGTDTDKTEDIKKAVSACSEGKKEALKTRQEIDAIWNCSDESLSELCPELKKWISQWKSDPQLEGCMYK